MVSGGSGQWSDAVVMPLYGTRLNGAWSDDAGRADVGCFGGVLDGRRRPSVRL